MLRRWLNKGDQEGATNKLRDRETYAKGHVGMSQYLADWDRVWRNRGGEADGHKRA